MWTYILADSSRSGAPIGIINRKYSRQKSRALSALFLGIIPPLTKYLCTRLHVELDGGDVRERLVMRLNGLLRVVLARSQGSFRSTRTYKRRRCKENSDNISCTDLLESIFFLPLPKTTTIAASIFR